MQTDAVAKIRAIAERIARSCGLDVFDVQFRRETHGWVLRVILDRPMRVDDSGAVLIEPPEDAIGIDECRQVSEDLSAVLDVEDPLEQTYTLEVSSPGLDRPLRGLNDYRRFTGRLAKIVVHEAVDGQMHFEGTIAGVEDEEVVLTVGRGKQKRIPFRQVSRGRLDVDF